MRILELNALSIVDRQGNVVTIGLLSLKNIPHIETKPNTTLRKIIEEVRRQQEEI